MKFGVFDHMDRGPQPPHQQYRERLELVAAYDRAGFHAYHLAEHHGTPLGIAAAPSVYLAAVAQRTSRLRFGPMVYTMSIYHPLRLLEEICMLDQMSEGRLELGIGRGISPIEMGFYGMSGDLQERYQEVLEVVMQGMTQGRLNFAGKHYAFTDVPVELPPFQRPHPPLWYGAARPDTASWAAGQRMNLMSNGFVEAVRAITDAFREGWARTQPAGAPLPLMGMSRHIVIAPTESAAVKVAESAYHRWFTSLLYLWRQKNMQIPLNFPENFADARKAGLCLVGTAATVREQAAEQIAAAGINYLLCRIAFGDVPFGQSMDTVAALQEEVLPALADAA
ncbi:MAG: LLM class flavin-dependent oxidoreductase [Gammaproteobacteria bacterium]